MPKYDPVSSYHRESVCGFTILTHRQVLAHPKDAAEARKELHKQLEEINRVVPTDLLVPLRKVIIWVEWNQKANGAAEFHPSAKWLEANDYNPAKAGSVEISNTRNFIRWSRAEQPCMVLHELAHAYHFRELGPNHSGITAAYQQAVERKLYDEVEYLTGGKKKAYSLTNDKEYFAELSEAYFGKNDFYPFTRTDLKKHDPLGYKLLQKVWGNPQAVCP